MALYIQQHTTRCYFNINNNNNNNNKNKNKNNSKRTIIIIGSSSSNIAASNYIVVVVCFTYVIVVVYTSSRTSQTVLLLLPAHSCTSTLISLFWRCIANLHVPSSLSLIWIKIGNVFLRTIYCMFGLLDIGDNTTHSKCAMRIRN